MSGNSTLLLDTVAWDLVVDLSGNIAVASAPYSQAQDTASAVKTFVGDIYYDTSYGIPYFARILAQTPPVSYLKSVWKAAALTVPGVVAAEVFITSFVDRRITGQVQIVNSKNEASAAGF